MQTVTTQSNGPSGASDSDSWANELFGRMFRLMHSFEQDNFDFRRYRGVPPTAFFADKHSAYFCLLVKHFDEFWRVRTLLGDDVSRTLFDQLILFRILGHLHVRLPTNNPETQGQQEVVQTWKVADTSDAGILGPLSIFLVPLDDGEVRLKCWSENVEAMFLSRQYYFDRGDETIAPAAGDHVIDAGGCFGDTALAFAQSVGRNGRVYTFDPIDKHCRIIRENLSMNPVLAERVLVFDIGLADEDRESKRPKETANAINPGATIFEGDLPTKRIDTLAAEAAFPRIDFIKMDIEGSELAALRGAESSLRRWKPELAISLYHRPEDFLTIPLWLDSLGCGYRFFLDHYSIHHEETVLYAKATQ